MDQSDKRSKELMDELLAKIKEASASHQRTAMVGSQLFSEILVQAGRRNLDSNAVFFVVTHLLAVIMQHTPYTFGEVLDETMSLCNTNSVMHAIKMFVVRAGLRLDNEELCPKCGKYHPEPPPPGQPDPSKCN